jgi:hypothetical protein
MDPRVLFIGCLVLIWWLARRARSLAREGGIPTLLVDLSLGFTIR